MDIQLQFASPPAAYRGKPFWAWNGPLDEAELRRQIRIFKKMGLGGAFLHARVGLATPYLTEEWFKLIRACADEAQKQGMEAWLYDEDRWPSGAAGGLVTQNPEYRMRFLNLIRQDADKMTLTGEELGVFIGKVQGGIATGVRAAAKGEKPAAGESALLFNRVLMDTSRWYNGQTYLDTLSAEAVKKFIEVTHDAYARDVLSKFGPQIVPGIFSDEPNYGHMPGKVDPNNMLMPWTDSLPEFFRKRHGYDLMDHLPEIFYNTGDAAGTGYSSVRHDYFDTLAYMFSSHFGGLIGKWCEEHNIAFTGHVLLENDLMGQSAVVGAAMRFYEYMQAPGIDILCAQGLERKGGSGSEYSTAKQCASVQRQFGRKWMLSELYGCTGWGFTFSEHKAVGDWQAALGVNLRCQHLAWYTMLGEAKRDYPASISFQSPWWRNYAKVEDYFARVGVLMNSGEPVRDVAVIHPIESAWGLIVPTLGFKDGSGPASKLNQQYMDTQNMLLAEHLDFDYVDEDIYARHGSVENGHLKVALAEYRAVVVPPTVTLRESTLQGLTEFADSGGVLVFVEPIPTRVNGQLSDDLAALVSRSQTIPLEARVLARALECVRTVSIRQADGKEYPHSLYMLRKENNGRTTLFVVNTIQSAASGPLEITLTGEGQVQEWDPFTGEVYLANAMYIDGKIVIQTDLPPVGSRLFVLDPAVDDLLNPRPALEESHRELIDQSIWPILRDEPNAFPLDMPKYSINGVDWQGPMEILKVDRAVRDSTGLAHRSGDMVQPWAQTAPPDSHAISVALQYSFRVETMPSGPCHLVMELPGAFFITLNGHNIREDQDEGWWIDNSFRRILIPPGLLKPGENYLRLEMDYLYNSNLESLYFCGEFGVRWDGGIPVITELPLELKTGDWTTQGFPNFSGALSYVTTIKPDYNPEERVFVEVPSWEGVLVNVRVNGVAAGSIAWQPYELDITDALQPGENRLELEIVSSRRNLLGPLHLTDPRLPWTGPDQFVSAGEAWTQEYVLFPYGLMDAPALSIRREQ